MGRELSQGRRVGNYTVERLLSRNGLYAVYAASYSQLVSQSPTADVPQDVQRSCALTVFYLDPDADSWSRYRREVEHVAKLRHPSLPEVVDVGVSEEGVPFLVTELVPGETLADRLRTRGALTLPQALAVARQVGAALYAGHAVGVLHRDVRPANIYLVTEPTETDAEPAFERVKLLNHGLSRLLEASLNWLGLVGDADYLAPEQVLGHPFDVDPRADQYALAVVLYQALSTSKPFHGDSVGGTLLQVVRGGAEPLRSLRADTPKHVEMAIARAMSREREARYPDIHAFLDVIQEGVPLPMGMAELTEPWLAAAADPEEAQRLALASGADPAAPVSAGVSAALEQAARSGPILMSDLQDANAPKVAADQKSSGKSLAATLAASGVPKTTLRGQSGPQAIPQVLEESATMPHSMEAVMQLAVPVELQPDKQAKPDASEASIEIVADPTPNPGVPSPLVSSLSEGHQRKGETEVLTRPAQSAEVLPSIIVDLPTRPVGEGDKLPPHVAAPSDPTRLAKHERRSGDHGFLDNLAEYMDRRAPLAERIGWALAGAGLGGLLMHLLS